MSLPSKNSNLAMFAAIAVSTMLLSAVTKADANPYMQGDMRIAEGDASTGVKKTTTVKPNAVNVKKKIQSAPGSMVNQDGDAKFKLTEGPIFVKSGKPADINKKVLPQSGAKSQPSAVDVQKKIESSTNN
jgi:hypothetical protein